MTSPGREVGRSAATSSDAPTHRSDDLAGVRADHDVAPERFGRAALVVTASTLLSRLTGFARVLVAAACLGVGPLGDTYAAANMIPNLIFELAAGGVLQAVLVPTFVGIRREGGDDALGRAAAAVASALTALLAAVAVVALALSPLVTGVLVGDGDGDAGLATAAH